MPERLGQWLLNKLKQSPELDGGFEFNEPVFRHLRRNAGLTEEQIDAEIDEMISRGQLRPVEQDA